MSERQTAGFRQRALRRALRKRSRQRGVALVMVLGALTVLTVMLTEFQDESASQFSSALNERDALKAEYAAKSGLNLSRLLIASEPTIRKALAPLFLMMRSGPPQIPVWEFADQVLGAFNDKEGAESFQNLSGLEVTQGRNLGLEGAGFKPTIVDEDAKINVNLPARGDAFSQARLGTQLIGLLGGQQYNALFEQRDGDGNFTDRQSVCAAIVDWTDPDQDAYVCDPHSGTAQQSATEDAYYQLLDDPYQRKNAAFDSLEELRLVRGVGDDFWSTFVEPDPHDPRKRPVTVWGQGKINVNTANSQTILALVCGYAQPGTAVCEDPAEAQKFLSAFTLVRGFTMGAPLFSSPKGFVNAMKGKGMFGTVIAMLNLQPVAFLSDAEMQKAVTTESKVFTISMEGYVVAGKRETRVRITAVVDFRGAPPPGMAPSTLAALAGAAGQGATAGELATNPNQNPNLQGVELPDGATDDAIASAFQKSPGGRIIYYRIE